MRTGKFLLTSYDYHTSNESPKLANKDMCDVKISLVNKVKIFFTAI